MTQVLKLSWRRPLEPVHSDVSSRAIGQPRSNTPTIRPAASGHGKAGCWQRGNIPSHDSASALCDAAAQGHEAADRSI